MSTRKILRSQIGQWMVYVSICEGVIHYRRVLYNTLQCVCVCVCMCVCVHTYVYVYVCMYVCMYIYMYIYIYTDWSYSFLSASTLTFPETKSFMWCFTYPLSWNLWVYLNTTGHKKCAKAITISPNSSLMDFVLGKFLVNSSKEFGKNLKDHFNDSTVPVRHIEATIFDPSIVFLSAHRWWSQQPSLSVLFL